MLARQVYAVEDSVAVTNDSLQGVLRDLLEATGSRWGRLTFEKQGSANILAGNFTTADPRAAGVIDPWRAGRPRVLGRAVRGESFLPPAAWKRSEYYLFAMRPGGVEPDHSLVASIACAGGEIVVFLARPAWDRPYSAEEQTRAEIFLPVVPRIAELHWRVEDEHLAAARKDAALAALSLDLLVTDGAGLVQYDNNAGSLLLGATRLLVVEDGRITTVDSDQREHFRDAMERASDKATPAPSLVHLKGAEGAWATVLVSPLDVNGTTAGQVLITLRTNGDQDNRLQAIRQLFGLSEVEGRLAWAITNGQTVADFAAARSVSINTARVQLTSVLRKTRTNRQAELVALLGAIPPIRLAPMRPRPQRISDRDPT